MKLLTILATLLLTVHTATAMSIHPCTPTVEAQPSIISCKEGNVYYSITINTLMSPFTKTCQGKNRYEYHTATVSYGTDGQSDTVLTIYNDEFSYSLGDGTGRSSFTSPKYNLNLNNCVSPMHGGFSIGN